MTGVVCPLSGGDGDVGCPLSGEDRFGCPLSGRGGWDDNRGGVEDPLLKARDLGLWPEITVCAGDACWRGGACVRRTHASMIICKGE